MPTKSYVPRGVQTPGQFRMPGRRPRRRPSGPTHAYPGGSGTTTGGRRYPARRPTPGGVSATPPRRPAPVYRPPTIAKAPTNYAKLTMPSRKGSGPFGDSELRAGYRRMGEALERADQPGVKAALEVRIREAKGEMPPAMTRGQHTALMYAAAGEKSKDVTKRRQGKAARIRLREQGY